MIEHPEHPYGYDVYTHTEVIPKEAPRRLRWTIGPVRPKEEWSYWPTEPTEFQKGDFTMQLTADQQVSLGITGEDKYGNPVEITGTVVWESSDTSIVEVINPTNEGCIAVAVGPVGTASVTVKNDANDDQTDDFQGSIAIDVVAGDIAEIEINAGTPEDKPAT